MGMPKVSIATFAIFLLDGEEEKRTPSQGQEVRRAQGTCQHLFSVKWFRQNFCTLLSLRFFRAIRVWHFGLRSRRGAPDGFLRWCRSFCCGSASVR